MITVTTLTKSYGPHTAVDDVSFSCAPGTITGFLGPNGAGKSTTLRMIAGRTPPTSGSSLIDGQRYQALANPGNTVGLMLDAAAQHPGRTGRETLQLTASLLGVERRVADAMLERVGLHDAVKLRVKQYSLGMRQRLGIANALIGDPHVLILDEPANGLDPVGIRWMRELLRDFADRGGTVLLSSHLLREVQATADHLVMIGNGRIVANGPLNELLGDGGTFVHSTDDHALAGALRANGLVGRPGDGGLLVDTEPTTVGRIALDAGLALVALRAVGDDGLEDLFFRLTDDPRDPASNDVSAA